MKVLRNILVVNVNWIGDVIFSAPVFAALRAAYPRARLACLAVPRVKEVLACIKEIDEILIYDERGADRSLSAKWRLIRRLKEKNFDVVFLLHRSLTRALLVFLAGVKERVGYAEKGRGFLLTHQVQPLNYHGERLKGFDGMFHRRDHYLNVLESYGVLVSDRTCHLSIRPAAQKYIDGILTELNILPGDFLTVIHPGGNWDLKRWPKQNFGRLIERLVNEQKSKVLICGSPADATLANEIAILSGVKPFVLTGRSDLIQLMALMARANVVISADSGPIHLANAVGTSVIGLFGPTRPEVTGPVGTGKSIVLQNDVGCNRLPCYFLKCPDNVCMQSIKVEDVLHAVRQIRN